MRASDARRFKERVLSESGGSTAREFNALAVSDENDETLPFEAKCVRGCAARRSRAKKRASNVA